MAVSLRNLSSSECFDDGKPWRFVSLSLVPPDAFKDKALRDAWVNLPPTSFHVYTLYEGVQKNLRLRGSRAGEDDNPPMVMDGLAIDYDTALGVEQVMKALPLMGDMLPTWFEQTLSGNGRLIWQFEKPLLLPSRRFLLKLLERISDLIPFRKLAGIDEAALKAPERYFTNGCRWTSLSRKKVPEALLRGFVLKVSEKFDWQQKEFGKAVNLPDIEEELRRVFPRFAEWPGEFVLGGQGPSFWVDGSTSPKSAIVRETGMHSFSAHATKAFYPWAELVGSEFVENNESIRLGKAVEGCYFDGRNFIIKDAAGRYAFHTKDNFRMILMGMRGLKGGMKKDGGQSEVDRAITHVLHSATIEGAASCAFFPHGVFSYGGKKILNTHQLDVMRPAEGVQVWGPEGKFPFLSKFFDGFLLPSHPQKEKLLAWFQLHYLACLNRQPRQGHGLFIAGPVGSGKTFFNRGVLGTALGGFAEANAYLVSSDNFNSELFDYALWVIDDGSVMSSEKMHLLFSENVKRAIANRDHRVNEKFRKAVMTPWEGRVVVTLNDDPESLRIIPNVDLSMLEKIFILRAGPRCVDFKSQPEMEALLQSELPFFLRWLVDWILPQHCTEGSEVRFGLAPYAEPTILQAANLSSGKSVFVEILTRWLTIFFTENSDADYWEGTATELRMAMIMDPVFAELMRAYKPEQLPRMLITTMTKGILKMEVMDDTMRRFRIHRDERFLKPKTAFVPQTENSSFEKR